MLRCEPGDGSVSCSVHLRVSEKLSVVAGRDGGLQNMEILGLIVLRIADPECGKIKVLLENNEKRAVQFQVSMCMHACNMCSKSYCTHILCINITNIPHTPTYWHMHASVGGVVVR